MGWWGVYILADIAKLEVKVPQIVVDGGETELSCSELRYLKATKIPGTFPTLVVGTLIMTRLKWFLYLYSFLPDLPSVRIRGL